MKAEEENKQDDTQNASAVRDCPDSAGSPACEDCRHWERLSSDWFLGFCKRFPPTLPINETTRANTFPITQRGAICGEFSLKENTD